MATSKAKFRGNNIFGDQQRQEGPIAQSVSIRERLPGVRGYRSYINTGTGPDTRTWIIRGRLKKDSLSLLQKAIRDNQDEINKFEKFVDTAGNSWNNCELIDYRQSSPYITGIENGIQKWFVEIVATVQQADPS